MRRLTPNPDTLLDDILKWAAGSPLRREHTAETKAKMRQAHARRKANPRGKAEWLASRRAWHRRHFPRLGERAIDYIVAAMDSACWYGSGDVANLAGLEGRHTRRVLVGMVRNGFAERRDNPDYVPRPFSLDPRFLYQLTPRGVALGDLIRGLK